MGIMICALCKQEKDKLIDSHFLPSAAYYQIRGVDELANEGPIHINIGKNSAFYTDRQIKKPLLCGDCEDLFSKNGERKMGELWATKFGFPLLELLRSRPVTTTDSGLNFYDGRTLDQHVVNAILYFAASIFWRAQVWDWGRDKDAYSRALGTKYELGFREFLLGKRKLENVLLLVDVNSHLKTSSMMSFPTCGRMRGDRVHSFSLLGIKFSMFVGRAISQRTKSPFEFYRTQVLFVASDHDKHPSHMKLAAQIQSNVVAKGKLARSQQ
ncbi:hypothetical protein [Pseudomonas sp. GL-RE-29]|uniref:hypothetical protein n=1 Tax=Pseudomonas sp. GL-RE-29 TaxID=2832375 RepID=UPI001CC1177C|nr:hypothetical protein [Pseudomonas sp. GL-RE-29]